VRGGSGPVLILFPTLALLFGFTNLFWPVRPQSASQMLLAALLLALSRNPHANAIQGVLVVSLLLLWSNLHGGALLGVAVVTVVAAGDFLDARRRSSFESGFDWAWRLASVLGGALTLLVTPYGYRGFLSAVRHVAGDQTATAPIEWQIPRIADYPIFLALLLLAVLGLLAALRNGHLEIRDALLLLWFALMGLSSLRYLEIAAIGLAFTGAMLWTSALRVKPLSLRMNMLAVASSVLLPVGLLVAGVGRDPFLFRGGWRPGRPLPVAATEYLAKNHITKRLANPYEWGGYIIWALRPCDVAFIDGRVDLYTQSLLDDYRILDAGAPGWKAVTDRYQIQAIIWRAGISELREVLAKDETFVPVYLDTTAAIYVRRDGLYSHIAAATLQGKKKHLKR
jgi:hypothetical protein